MDRGLHQQWRVDWFGALIKKHSKQKDQRFRLLDLACLEGLFAVEFARAGATTIGVEIREGHIEKARFAARALGLSNCAFVQADVRKMPDLGRFDAVLCAGILYHLDFPDCVTFLEDIAKRSSDLIIIDSHIAYDHIAESVLPLAPMKEYLFRDRPYRGREIIEHAWHVDQQQKAQDHVWASIDNTRSVWLVEDDILAIMLNQGFSLVQRGFPSIQYATENPDRPTLVFKKRVT
jgi:2-polyprenyl-3-methyl-5-hydroxy-6-metoxy-1,4-benzoquinol methylase